MTAMSEPALKICRHFRSEIIHRFFSCHLQSKHQALHSFKSANRHLTRKKGWIFSFRTCDSESLSNFFPTMYIIESLPIMEYCRCFSQMKHRVLTGKKSLDEQNRTFSSFSESEGQLPDVPELVRKILQKTKEMDVMADSLPKDTIKDLVETLLAQGFNDKQLDRLLTRRLWLLQQPKPTSNLTQLLLLHGFSHILVCQLIKAIPYNLQNCLEHLSNDRINKMIFFFGSLGYSDEDITSLLTISPTVLYLDSKRIETALAKLKLLFSAKDIRKLVKKSPSILADSWSEVHRKYEYAVYKMVYHNIDIVNSNFFSHSFDHIKNRHLFLARSGLFLDVSVKTDPELNPNPKLNDVVDKPNSAFIKLFPVASLKEYHIFCEMRAIEEEVEEEEEEDDDGEDYEHDSEDESEVAEELTPGAKNIDSKEKQKKGQRSKKRQR